jgi:hypothetical protein
MASGSQSSHRREHVFTSSSRYIIYIYSMTRHSQGKNKKKIALKLQVKIKPSSQEWGSVLSRRNIWHTSGSCANYIALYQSSRSPYSSSSRVVALRFTS